jgi:hypothetical protein
MKTVAIQAMSLAILIDSSWRMKGFGMATLSMFFGIIIKMYKERDGRHHRPHIHAQHADKTASFDLETSDILAGEMDKDDVDRIRGWMSIHREELFANWKLLGEEGTYFKIEPLR